MLTLIISISLLAGSVFGRIHYLNLQNDERQRITLSSFGFLKGGLLTVNMTGFSFQPENINRSALLFGFTLDKNVNNAVSSYWDNTPDNCALRQRGGGKKESDSMIYFLLDLDKKKISVVKVGDSVTNLTISNQTQELFRQQLHLKRREKRYSQQNAGKINNLSVLSRIPRDAPSGNATDSIPNKEVTKGSTPTTVVTKVTTSTTVITNATNPTTAVTKVAYPVDGATSEDLKPEISENDVQRLNQPVEIELFLVDGKEFSTFFLVYIQNENEEGFYNLYFHNCYGNVEPGGEPVTISISMHIEEVNNGNNYLSAGDMPLPYLYFTACIIYLIASLAWIHVLRKSSDVYKIHWLMLAVVIMKSLSNFCHGVNMHFTEIYGYHEEAWAILYYIVYLAKGALMFIAILLIGAGWAFVKHMLSDKEKKLFLIFIPLQVLDQVAWVIIEESEEGQGSYFKWKETFILVDLLCCGAILFPVVWSIKHLQEASGIDGKAAINLSKLKLFRQFYILVICYIYFTRIIIYLMKITLPFKLEWLTEMFLEMAILTFFIITGCKFRPASDNPYLQVPQDSDDEIQMEEVLTKTGDTETVVRVNQHYKPAADESQEPLIKQRESSHEYD